MFGQLGYLYGISWKPDLSVLPVFLYVYVHCMCIYMCFICIHIRIYAYLYVFIRICVFLRYSFAFRCVTMSDFNIMVAILYMA